LHQVGRQPVRDSLVGLMVSRAVPLSKHNPANIDAICGWLHGARRISLPGRQVRLTPRSRAARAGRV